MTHDEVAEIQAQIAAQLSEAVAQSEQAQQQALADRTGTGTSAEGHVTATLDRNGFLQHCEFDPAIAELTAEELRDAVLQAIQEARTDLTGGAPATFDQAVAALQDTRLVDAFEEALQRGSLQ